MKTRMGFVSNSSSSSFVVFGTSLDITDAVQSRRKKLGREPLPDGENENENEDEAMYEDVYEEFGSVADEVGLMYDATFDEEDVWVGLRPQDIKDDETGAQFKARAVKTINDAFGLDLKVSDFEWIDEVISS